MSPLADPKMAIDNDDTAVMALWSESGGGGKKKEKYGEVQCAVSL